MTKCVKVIRSLNHAVTEGKSSKEDGEAEEGGGGRGEEVGEGGEEASNSKTGLLLSQRRS